MFCQKCGAYNPEQATVCTGCGNPLPQSANNSQAGAQGAETAQAGGSINFRTAAQQSTQPQQTAYPRQTGGTENAQEQRRTYTAAPGQAGEPKPVSDYLVPSILVAILASGVFGAVALVFSVLTSAALKAGEKAKAELYSRRTKMFCWIGLALGIAKIVLAILWFAIVFGFIGILSRDLMLYY